MLTTVFALFLTLSPAVPADALAAPEATVDVAAADHTDAWRSYLTEQRARQLERLAAYVEQGAFPRSWDPGLTNVFRDDRGRLCAMANLIAESGERELVAATADANNGIKLGEVTEGPLLEWILTSGFTQEEVAFVQVPDFQGRWEEPIEMPRPIEVQQRIVDLEVERIRAHLRAASLQVELFSPKSIEVALERLGDRVHSPPPGSRAS